MRKPLVPGVTGFAPVNRPPAFDAERPGPFAWNQRRWPAAMRVLANETLYELPKPAEDALYREVRKLMHRDVSRTLLRTELNALALTPFGKELLRWMRKPSQRRLMGWWRSTRGWKSSREFNSYRPLESRSGLPHVEPFEVANRRLTDDIAMDHDVVTFQAWCQGVQNKDLEGSPFGKRHHETIRAGLVKFLSSPWIMFTIAAPFMQPTGVKFPGQGYIDSCMRIDWLIRHPLEATDGEIEHIMSSRMFEAGYAAARKARRSGKYMNPNGTWYNNARISLALGDPFRRGGVWFGRRVGWPRTEEAASP